MKRAWVALVFLFFFSQAVLAQGTVSERLAFIEGALSEEAFDAKLWQYGWTGVYGALTLAEGVHASTMDVESQGDEEARHDATVNAFSSAIGLAGMVFDPLTLHSDLSALKLMPEATEKERRMKLKVAEGYLKAAALREKRGRSVASHLLAGVVNLAAGLAVTFDGGRQDDGLLVFASGMLVSEIQIFTMPKRAVGAWETYQRGSVVTPFGAADRLQPFSIGLGGRSVQFAFTF